MNRYRDRGLGQRTRSMVLGDTAGFGLPLDIRPQHSAGDTRGYGRRLGHLPKARTGIVDLRPVRMDQRIHGLIDLNSFPFKIAVNAGSLPARQRVTLVHEILHAIDHMYKLKLPHASLHVLSVQFMAEILPILEKLGWIRIVR